MSTKQMVLSNSFIASTKRLVYENGFYIVYEIKSKLATFSERIDIELRKIIYVIKWNKTRV